MEPDVDRWPEQERLPRKAHLNDGADALVVAAVIRS
jgi:hypothetical protein